MCLAVSGASGEGEDHPLLRAWSLQGELEPHRSPITPDWGVVQSIPCCKTLQLHDMTRRTADPSAS